QVQNSLTDIFGARFVPTDLPLDGDALSFGLTSIGDGEAVTSGLAAEQYLTYFTEVSNRLWTDGARRQALVGDGCAPREANDPCVRAFFQRLGLQVWLPPLTDEEVNGLVDVVAAVGDASGRDLWV